MIGTVCVVSGSAFADSAGPQANVVGKVLTADSQPVQGVDVALTTAGGAAVASTTTAADGSYSFGCVDTGAYHLAISPKGDFKGQNVKAPVGPNGLSVAWAVDKTKPALASATATGGACGAAVVAGAAAVAGASAGGGSGTLLGTTGGMVVGGGALAAGVGLGIASASGAFNPDSPAQ